jgi:putative ABC transport system substrate-binding protein
MRRREFIARLGGAAAWPLAARAQQAGKVARIGYLSPGSASGRTDAFRQGLREVGYVEKKNILIEYRFAEGNFDRLADLAAQLVQLKVDVIVAEATQASLAAKDATRTIPIIMLIVADPVGSGLVGSLARPGANLIRLSRANEGPGSARTRPLDSTYRPRRRSANQFRTKSAPNTPTNAPAMTSLG